ncbi:hypothetical protein [Leuconostoc citreum]
MELKIKGTAEEIKKVLQAISGSEEHDGKFSEPMKIPLVYSKSSNNVENSR